MAHNVPMEQMKVTVTPDLRSKVKQEAKKEDRSESAIVRRALRAYFLEPQPVENEADHAA